MKMKIVVLLSILSVSIHAMQTAPGRLGQAIAAGQYKAYEQQLVDGEISAGQYLQNVEERDRPPWGSYAYTLQQMRAASYTRSSLGDFYAQLKNDLDRIVYAYQNNTRTMIEVPRGNFVNGQMNNINDFTTQAFALIERYCKSFREAL